MTELLIVLIALAAFVAGRVTERRHWVGKAKQESDYRWLN